MADQDDFNSSDLEFEAPPERGDHYGQKSIQQMLESAFEDRIESKRASKLLTDDVGDPGTRIDKFLVFNRFKAFYTTTLKKSADVVPVGEDIVRFFTTITSHMTSSMAHVPRYSTQLRYLQLLITKLTFLYPKFTLAPDERTRIFVCLKSLLQEGKLTNDPHREAQWVGISLVKRMVKAMIEDAVASGTRSWDCTIAKALSIVLLGALGSRGGDITLSRGYKNAECLRWEHIHIKLKPGTQKLSMRITIAYEKGHKDDATRNRIVDIDALDSPQDNALCPVKWLLIHALRHGCVQGKDIKDVILQASRRVDKSLVWTYPKHPVLASIKIGGVFLDLSKPARIQQLRNTIRYAGLVAGLLVKITPHDLRRGCFRDMTKASVAPPTSLTDVADIMGHNRSSLHNGVTARYTNGIQDAAILEKRIRGAEAVDKFGIALTDVPFKKIKISKEEVDAQCEITALDASKLGDRAIARRQIRERETQQWMDARKNDVVHSETVMEASSRKALAPLPINKFNVSAQPTLHNSLQILLPQSQSTTGVHRGMEDETMIDPGFLRDTFADITNEEEDATLSKLDQTLVEDLEAALSQSSNLELNENMHAALFPISEPATHDKDLVPWEIEGSDFVTYFSKINIVRNASVSKCGSAKWHEEARDKNIVATGNTRDMPTPFLYLCPNNEHGCQHKAINPQDVEKHFRSCKITSAEAADEKYSQKAFPCTVDGCKKSFATAAAKATHYTNCHSYTPRGCDKGCDPTVILQTQTAWKNHVAAEHGGFPKAFKCLFPGCISTTLFNKAQNLTQHLVKCHGLNSPEARLPYIPVWRPRACPEPGCKRTLVFQKPIGLINHILKDHHRAIDASSDLEVAWD